MTAGREPYRTAEFEARFWSRVDKDGPVPAHAPELGPCWVWIGCRVEDGYGVIHVGNKQRRAHVISFLMAGGQLLPECPLTLHHCDNRPCVRPSHLYAGTVAQNAADMKARGRAATGDRNAARLYPESRPRGDRNGSRLYPESRPRGEAIHTAKLTARDIPTIRRLVAEGTQLKVIACMFGVSDYPIRCIRDGKTWTHV